MVWAMEEEGFRNYENEWWHFSYPVAGARPVDLADTGTFPSCPPHHQSHPRRHGERRDPASARRPAAPFRAVAARRPGRLARERDPGRAARGPPGQRWPSSSATAWRSLVPPPSAASERLQDSDYGKQAFSDQHRGAQILAGAGGPGLGPRAGDPLSPVRRQRPTEAAMTTQAEPGPGGGGAGTRTCGRPIWPASRSPALVLGTDYTRPGPAWCTSDGAGAGGTRRFCRDLSPRPRAGGRRDQGGEPHAGDGAAPANEGRRRMARPAQGSRAHRVGGERSRAMGAVPARDVRVRIEALQVDLHGAEPNGSAFPASWARDQLIVPSTTTQTGAGSEAGRRGDGHQGRSSATCKHGHHRPAPGSRAPSPAAAAIYQLVLATQQTTMTRYTGVTIPPAQPDRPRLPAGPLRHAVR